MPSPDEMSQAVIASLPRRTGRSLDEWLDVVGHSGIDPLDQPGVRRLLKQEHGLGQNTQWAIAFAAARAAGWRMPTPEEFADEMYRGRRMELRPIHDALVAAALACGPGTRIEGRAGYTPVIHARQFAAIGPGPRLTVRVGMRFTTPPVDERVDVARGFAQATHWAHVGAGTDPAEAAEQVMDLLRLAWSQNA